MVRVAPVPTSTIPAVIYGTAWKEDRTQELVELAIGAGFRGVDTANQRLHYVEEGVGAAVAAAGVARRDLFLQTKFTYLRGQGGAQCPYDESADLATQVAQSMASSLEHLRTTYVDSFILHAPASMEGWTDNDAETWSGMRREREAGRARLLGVSNVSATHLTQLEATGAELPAIVQNRCSDRLGWDRAVRRFCKKRGIVYQGFSVVNPKSAALRDPLVLAMAARFEATPAQALFAFARASGIVAITGATNVEHMRQNLASQTLKLSRKDVRAIDSLV